MNRLHEHVARKVAHRFSQLPQVEAVAVAGSVATGRANTSSDVDIYIYPSSDLSPDLRLSIGQEFSPDAQIVDYWGPATVWFDAETGIEVEALFFSVGWMEDLVLQPLEKHRAQMGFTTSFWHTIKVSQILFNRSGWLTRLQQKANQPYPTELVQAIVSLNYPLLRNIYPSYRAQIASAIQRSDLLVINKTMASFFDSYFDILFALNRMPHPGVKRMLEIMEHECEKYPVMMREHVTQLLKLANTISDEILGHVDKVVDSLETLLRSEDLI